MHALTDLGIYANILKKFSNSAYFSEELKSNVLGVLDVVQLVLLKSRRISEEQIFWFSEAVSIFCRHLEGSTKNELPYEIDHCMRCAVNDWCTLTNYTIAHALFNRKNFSFNPYAWDTILNISQLMGSKFHLSKRLVLVGTPRIYAHFPLFCTPLYHEIGHFVDLQLGISSRVYNQDSVNGKKIFKNWRHCAEHFADFFAACYVGDTIVNTMKIICPSNRESKTHPDSSKRIEFVEKFLENEDFYELCVFQEILENTNHPKLEIKYEAPDIRNNFNDTRPYKIKNDQELHGILNAGWKYLSEIELNAKPIWCHGLSHFDCVRIVNGLVEKSIRNYIILNKWEGQKNE